MDDKKQVHQARSREDGIVFISNKIPALCYEAYINQNGEVETRIQPTIVSNIKDMGVFINSKSNAKIKRKVELYCKIAILFLAIASVIISKRVSIAVGLLYFSIIALKDVIDFTEAAWGLKAGKYKSTGRFHSAEHMVLNAYEKKQGIPTLEEIKSASRFDKACSSRKYINKILIFGLLCVVMSLSGLVKIYVYLSLFAVLIIFSKFQQKYNLCKFLQILVTNKPTDKELKVALAGIEFFDKMESELPDIGCPIGGIIMAIDVFDDDENSAEN